MGCNRAVVICAATKAWRENDFDCAITSETIEKCSYSQPRSKCLLLGLKVIRRLHYSPESPHFTCVLPRSRYERVQHLIVAAGARSFNIVD